MERETRMIPESHKTTVTLDLEAVDIVLSVNQDIFTVEGDLKIRAGHLKDGENLQLLALEWPVIFRNNCEVHVSYWNPLVTFFKSERKQEFMEASLKEMAMNKWEMVTKIASKCLSQFNAHLLEVTFWGITLGHPDARSAQDAKQREKEICKVLSCLLADTDFLFCDIKVEWVVSVGPCPPQLSMSESALNVYQDWVTSFSTQDSFAVDGPRSTEESQAFPAGSSGSHDDVGIKIADERQILTVLHHEIISLKRSILQLGKLPEIMDRVCSKFDECHQTFSKFVANGIGSRICPVDNRTDLPADSCVDSRQVGEETETHEKSAQSSVSVHKTGSASAGGVHMVISGNSGHTAPGRHQQQTSHHHRTQSVIRTQQLPHPAAVTSNSSASTAQQTRTGHRGQLTSSKTPTFSCGSDQMRNSNAGRTGGQSIKGSARLVNDGNHSPNNSTRETELKANQSSPVAPQAQSLRQGVSSRTQTHASSTIEPADGRKAGIKQSKDDQGNKKPSPQVHFQQPQRNYQHQESISSSSRPPQSQASFSTKSVSQERMEIHCDSEDEARLVKESVDRAYLEDEVKPPKAKSFDTILCLDISDSMQDGGAFTAMKKTALAFIDGIENVITNSGVEENIGLVTFGQRANVVQNLTNDLSLIRSKIEQLKAGGKSPFVEALLVSMAAFVRKGGVVSVSGEWEVKPRIIFISDGYPTESSAVEGMDLPSNITSVRTSLIRMLMSFKTSDNFTNVHPVIFVPVGERADKKYMKTISELCDGVYLESEKITTLCHYFRVQETIGKVLVCLKRESDTVDEKKIEATIMALTPEIDDEQKKEVIDIVQRELKAPSRIRRSNPRPNELDYIFEDKDKVNSGDRLPLGSRVKRGPDWDWGDQDRGGPGTVFQHDEKHSIHWVAWDRGDYNCYPYSKRRGYHIWPAEDEDQHRIMGPDGILEIGMTVKKGPDWKTLEEYPNFGEEKGIVVRKSKEKGKVVVRWPGGLFRTYQWSPSGVKEVDYCDPLELATVHRSDNCKQKVEETGLWDFSGPGQWQWHDMDGTWHSYSPGLNRTIEDTFKKGRVSCLIERDGKHHRIMFKKKVEKVIDASQTECEIRRIPVQEK